MLKRNLNRLISFFGDRVSAAILALLAAFLFIDETDLIPYLYNLQTGQKVDNNLVLILLDEKFPLKDQYPTSPPRDYLTKLIHELSRYNPDVIALDYQFYESEKNDSSFQKFVKKVKIVGNVVLPCLLGKENDQYVLQNVSPLSLRIASRTGYPRLWGNPVLSTYLLVKLKDGRIVPSFALAAVAGIYEPQTSFSKDSSRTEYIDGQEFRRFRHIFSEKDWQELLKNQLNISDASQNKIYIKYLRKNLDPYIPTFSSETFLQASEDNIFPAEELNNKLVLIGSTYADPNNPEFDHFVTPVGRLPGVEIHANIINMLLTRDYLHVTSVGYVLLISFITLLVPLLTLSIMELKQAAWITIGYLLLYTLVVVMLFSFMDVWLPVIRPLQFGFFGFLVVYYLRSRKNQKVVEGDNSS